jgi:hypothetical protein
VQTLKLEAGSTVKMFQYQDNNSIQETMAKMSFEFKWITKKAQHVKTSKYGHAQAATIILTTINFNLVDIGD